MSEDTSPDDASPDSGESAIEGKADPSSPDAAEPPLAQRFLKATVLLLLLAGVPVGVAIALVGSQAATGAMLGAFAVFLVSLTTGWRAVLWFLPALVVVAEVAAATAGGWGWVALLAGLGFAAGWAARWGLLQPVVILGVFASVIQPVDSPANYRWLGVSLLLAGLYALWLLHRMGVAAEVPGFRTSAGMSTAAAVTLALITGGAAALALEWSAPRSFWIPMTVFLLIMPSAGMTVRERARHRVVGTAVGVALAAPVITLGLPFGLDMLLAVVAIVSSIALSGPAWRAAALIAFAIVLLLDGHGTDPEAAVSRVVATVGGALLAVTGGVVLARLAQRRELSDLGDLGDHLSGELVEGPDNRDD